MPPTDDQPIFIDHSALRGLPFPVQLVVGTAMLPLEAAVTSVKILKNTEALLAELVFHLNVLRPAVQTMSHAYACGHFDPVFKTFDQLATGTNAISYVYGLGGRVLGQVVALPGAVLFARPGAPGEEPVPPASMPETVATGTETETSPAPARATWLPGAFRYLLG